MRARRAETRRAARAGAFRAEFIGVLQKVIGVEESLGTKGALHWLRSSGLRLLLRMAKHIECGIQKCIKN